MNADVPVFIAGVWHSAQPICEKTRAPSAIDAAPPGAVVDGVGGASRRMNIAKPTVSLGTAVVCIAVMLVASSGVGFNRQFAGKCRFIGTRTLVREELVGDAHFDVVGFARENLERFVLRLPAEAG